MWDALTSWASVGIIVPVLISVGLGVFAINPISPVVARVCFSSAASILSVRLAWWLVFEQKANKYESIVAALFSSGIIGALWAISMKWVNNGRDKALQLSEVKKHGQDRIVVQLPPSGNLKQRAIALSYEIMGILQQKPTSTEDYVSWAKSRSEHFKHRFMERIIEIRNEFSQLHIRDQDLDEILKYKGIQEDAKKRLASIPELQHIDLQILPWQIERLAERLAILADHLD